MRKLKKVLATTLAIATVCNTLPCFTFGASLTTPATSIEAEAASVTYYYYGNFKYYQQTVGGVKQSRICGYTGTPTQITIPQTINGGKVYINSDAFQGCSSLTKVTINEGVTHICGSAFANCQNLRRVYLPASIQIIFPDAFDNCVDVEFTGPGVPEMVETYADDWIISNGINTITHSNSEMQKYLRAAAIWRLMQREIRVHESAYHGDPASVLATKEGLCGGFSRTFYHLCLSAGIPASDIRVVGDFDCHAWNYIRFNGKWFNIDVMNRTLFLNDSEYETYMINAFNRHDPSCGYSHWSTVSEMYFGYNADNGSRTLSSQGLHADQCKYDINGDGTVNSRDLVCLSQCINGNFSGVIIPNADINHDGAINNTDLNLLKAVF